MAIFGKKAETSSKTSKDSSAKQPENTEPALVANIKDNRVALLLQFRQQVDKALMSRIDLVAASKMPSDQLRREVEQFVTLFATEQNVDISAAEQRTVALTMVNDMIGLGPLEALLADESITDIMVNNAKKIYVERKGKLELVPASFRDETHLLQIAQRIASRIGRRVDETSPMVDARLADGSRVNIIVPPLALDGTSISIRKFSKRSISLDHMVSQGNLSAPVAQFLKIAMKCRLNILVSGGTGSGKTTLLNALSQLIDPGERIVTAEDAAELRLQQPHIVRLESRPPNIEGEGEVTIRDLVKNALRMRPDRIVIGEVRGGETLDMLQAMNTGHDGSMSTIHANRAREVITRLENMVAMTGLGLTSRVIRSQIAGAVNLIVHVSRMRDGVRRVNEILEVTGFEDENVSLQTLFSFSYTHENEQGFLQGTFKYTGVRPAFFERATYFDLADELSDVLSNAS